jgi:hypothetical protein
MDYTQPSDKPTKVPVAPVQDPTTYANAGNTTGSGNNEKYTEGILNGILKYNSDGTLKSADQIISEVMAAKNAQAVQDDSVNDSVDKPKDNVQQPVPEPEKGFN